MRQRLTRRLSLFLALSLAFVAVAASPAWPARLFIDGGGRWTGRVPLHIANSGEADLLGRVRPLPIAEGSPLIGEIAGTLRVVDDHGTQLKYRVVNAQGETLQEQAVTAGCLLYVPVSVKASGEATYYIYIGNRKAWFSPDLLPEPRQVRNTGFEEAERGLPKYWHAEMSDRDHRLSVSEESPAEGRRCLKAEVQDGASPSWFKLHTGAIAVEPGSKVSIRVKVRGERTGGHAGWYVHCGNSSNGMKVNHVATVKESTFGWRELAIDFTAPEDADRLVTGSVFNGQGGIAWYDDFRLLIQPTSTVRVTLRTGTPEWRETRELGQQPLKQWNHNYAFRLPLRVVNSLDQPMEKVLACVSVSDMRNLSVRQAIVEADGKPQPTFQLGGNLFFHASVPPRTTRYYYLYTNEKTPEELETPANVTHTLGSDIPSDQILVEQSNGTDMRQVAALLAGSANLAANPSFEDIDAQNMPTGWSAAGEKRPAAGVQFGTATPGGFGRRHAFMTVPADAPTDWIGWRQSIPVKPGHHYIYGVWLLGDDKLDTSVAVHAHLRDANGDVVDSGYLSAPASGKPLQWTPCFGIAAIPATATHLQVHLTMNGHGTLRHDGVIVAETTEVQVEAIQSRPLPETDLALWQVDPVFKVFPETIAETAPIPGDAPYGRATLNLTSRKLTVSSPFGIEMARREQEPLQLALRAGRDLQNLSVKVDGLQGTGVSCEVGVVGFVPIDWRSSYFGSRQEAWIQLVPGGQGASDGWAGLWPDPIRPEHTFSLQANSTQPLWLLFKTTPDARPGTHAATVTIEGQGVRAAFPVQIRVWRFTLPENATFAALYDIRLSHHWNRPGVPHDQIRREIMQLMKEKKLCPDSVGADPHFKRQPDGSITADFTAYDKAATVFFDEMKFPVSYTPGIFYMFGWAYPPKTLLGEKPFDGDYPWDKGEPRDTLRPEYKKTLQTMLRLYMDHLREKGWDKKVVYYISDEPHFSHPYIRNQMKALCQAIREVEPGLLIYTSSWRHCKDWDGYISLWGAGHYGCFPEDEIRERRQAGERFWFTTDGQMCTDTPFAGIERLLPYYCFKYGADAYEFWGGTWLTLDPWKYGWHSYIRQSDSPTQKPYWIRYPNGDGYIMYPGQQFGDGRPVTSVRMEAARDGVDDHEYFTMLKAIGTPEAKALLQDVCSLVDMPSAGGRYTSRFMRQPLQIRAVRYKVGSLLDRFQDNR